MVELDVDRPMLLPEVVEERRVVERRQDEELGALAQAASTARAGASAADARRTAAASGEGLERGGASTPMALTDGAGAARA